MDLSDESIQHETMRIINCCRSMLAMVKKLRRCPAMELDDEFIWICGLTVYHHGRHYDRTMKRYFSSGKADGNGPE